MAIFRYAVEDKQGKVLRGVMDGNDAQEVVRRLTERGFANVQIEDSGYPQVVGGTGRGVRSQDAVEKSVGKELASPGVRNQKSNVLTPYHKSAFALTVPTPSEAAMFYRQMASLLHAGFNVSTALADLGGRTSQRAIRQAAQQMASTTAQGLPLAPEMAKHPTVFPAHVVGLVAAGETGGFLEFAFEEAALNAEMDAAVTQGLWWPRFLFWQSVWSVLLFQPLFPSLNLNNLPDSVATYFRTLLFLCLPIGLGLHLFAELWRRLRYQPFARDFFDRMVLWVPVVARLAHVRAVASFTRVLRRLLMSGISAETAYAGAVEAVPNAVLREKLRVGLPIVRSGGGLDAAVQATRLFANDPIQLLITGQKTGQFIEMLDRVTAFYQEEAARATDAAKDAQKRAGVVLTLVSSGYVMIVATHGLASMGFKYTESWTE